MPPTMTPMASLMRFFCKAVIKVEALGALLAIGMIIMAMKVWET